MPKYQSKHLYFYVGKNGLIFALDFDFKGKAYSIEYTFFWCRFNIEA